MRGYGAKNARYKKKHSDRGPVTARRVTARRGSATWHTVLCTGGRFWDYAAAAPHMRVNMNPGGDAGSGVPAVTRGTKRVLEYGRLAMGFANVRASRYGIR